MNTSRSEFAQGGFTLAEILVAMSVLLIGMAGIISLFTAGLNLERRSSLAIDTAVALRDVEPLVRAETVRRLASGDKENDLDIPRTPIPGWVGLDYTAKILPMEGNESNEGYVMKITVIPRGAPEDKGISYGYLPLRFGPTYEEMVRAASQETLIKKK